MSILLPLVTQSHRYSSPFIPLFGTYRASLALFSIRHGDDSVGMFLSYLPHPSFHPLAAELTLSYLLPSPFSHRQPPVTPPPARYPFSFVLLPLLSFPLPPSLTPSQPLSAHSRSLRKLIARRATRAFSPFARSFARPSARLFPPS